LLIFAMGLALASCSMVTNVVESFSPPPPPLPDPDPLPDYRQLIAASIREIFPDPPSLRSVAISQSVQRTQMLDGPAWRVCLKADVKNMNGDYIGVQTYVIAIRRNRVTDRRRAAPEDFCDSEKFEPFAF
jgi:hypothetical protein